MQAVGNILQAVGLDTGYSSISCVCPGLPSALWVSWYGHHDACIASARLLPAVNLCVPVPAVLFITVVGVRYMDEHGIDVHCLVPLPWLECEPGLHANETKALEVTTHRRF